MTWSVCVFAHARAAGVPVELAETKLSAEHALSLSML